MRTGKISKKLKEKARIAIERKEKQRKEQMKRLLQIQQSGNQFSY